MTPSEVVPGRGPASPPRVDAHQHFWHYSAAAYPWIDERMTAIRRDFLPDDLAPLMRAAGFDLSIAVQARQTVDETRSLLAFADASPFVAGVVGWVDLQADDVEEQLAHWSRHPKLVGVRHIAQDEPDDRFLLRPAVCRGIGLLARFGLSYDLLIYPKHLAVASDLVARFPAQRFVLDHLAKPSIRTGAIDDWARDLARLARHPHVCAKLSGLVTEADWAEWTPDAIRPCLDVALSCFGAERLMIGSDWPVCTVAADYTRTMRVVEDWLADRSVREREAILGGTARSFWNLGENGLAPAAPNDGRNEGRSR